MLRELHERLVSRHRPVVQIAARFAIAAAVSGCGGLVAGSSNAADDGGTPDVDGGPPNAAPSPAEAGQPSVPVPKPPNPLQRCTFNEGPWLIDSNGAPAELVVRMQNAQLLLYVRLDRRIDRYTVASADPCVLERDPDFSPSFARAGVSQFAVDDHGNLWSSSEDKLQRAFPLPVLNCTTGAGYRDANGDLYYVGGVFLDDDGKGGWGLDGPRAARQLRRLTLGPDACSVDLADSPWGSLPVRPNTPRDGQGRLHVLDAPVAGAIGIFTSTGTLVKSYSGKSVPTDPAPLDVTRCSGGVCVVSAPDPAGQQSIVYLDENGNPRGPAVRLFKGLRANSIAAARSGAVFVAGDSDPSIEAYHQVVIQMAPAPP